MEHIKKQAVKELAEMLKTHDLSEIEYEENGFRIRVVSRQGKAVLAPKNEPVKPALSETAPLPNTEPVKEKNNLVSPMVGIVYLSKAPNEPPFVKPGDAVHEGDTICLIEAMKTFNPIKAVKSGKIAAVLVESGSPVEFNQPLFTLE